MTDHVFAVNVYQDLQQAMRLLRILRRYYADNSSAIVHLSGPGYAQAEADELASLATVIRDDHEPDKCRGIITALNAMVRRAGELGAQVVSLLHPDMVPTDRRHWQTFLRRFLASKKALTYAPVWAWSDWPSFCALHIRLPDAARLFPIPLERTGGHACNEAVTGLHFDKVWAEWQENAYQLAIINHPLSSCQQGGPNAKLMHAPERAWVAHDFCPETSVIHTNDPAFWDNYDAVARF